MAFAQTREMHIAQLFNWFTKVLPHICSNNKCEREIKTNVYSFSNQVNENDYRGIDGVTR